MYSLKFHLFVFLLIGCSILPFFLSAIAFVIYERIQARLEVLRSRERRFKNINYLIEIFKDENSELELLEEALEAFNAHFMNFSGFAKDSKEYQDCLEFIGAFAWCPNMDIDRVVRYREEIVKVNPDYKKEIETVIGSALKNREETKKKK